MATKGLNLNPGANASLVTAATRAGLASAPPDYSKTFQNVSANYDITMQANAKMWGGIASSVAKVGVEIAKNLQYVVNDKCVLGISNTSLALKDETIINNFEGIVCDKSLKVFGHFTDPIARLNFALKNK